MRNCSIGFIGILALLLPLLAAAAEVSGKVTAKRVSQ